MKIGALKNRQGIEANKKLFNLYFQFSQLIKELGRKGLPASLIESINKEINKLNSIDNSAPNLRMSIIKIQTRIIRLLEKEIKLVPKNYYRNIWLPLGMGAFGLPIGIVIGLSTKNMGLLAIGLPIGLAIGIAVGTALDKKALKEGRQLEIDIKY